MYLNLLRWFILVNIASLKKKAPWKLEKLSMFDRWCNNSFREWSWILENKSAMENVSRLTPLLSRYIWKVWLIKPLTANSSPSPKKSRTARRHNRSQHTIIWMDLEAVRNTNKCKWLYFVIFPKMKNLVDIYWSTEGFKN